MTKKVLVRSKSHWCHFTINKHKKCGGKVYTIIKVDERINNNLKDNNFKISKCNCYCHKLYA